MRAAVQVVFFDLFETLVTEIGPDWPDRTPAQRLGIDDEIFRRVRRTCHQKRMTRRVDFRDILARACNTAGVEVTRGKRALIEDIYAQRLREKALPFERVSESVLQALHQIKSLGIRLGVISNCSVEEVMAWPTCQLMPIFDDVVFSYEVGYMKPDPEIYRLACRRLGITPDQAMFVGDGGSDELRGASAVGMRAYAARWFVNKWPQSIQHKADAGTAGFTTLDNLDALVLTIEKLRI